MRDLMLKALRATATGRSYDSAYASEAVVTAFLLLEEARVKMIAAQEAAHEVELMYGRLYFAMLAAVSPSERGAGSPLSGKEATPTPPTTGRTGTATQIATGDAPGTDSQPPSFNSMKKRSQTMDDQSIDDKKERYQDALLKIRIEAWEEMQRTDAHGLLVGIFNTATHALYPQYQPLTKSQLVAALKRAAGTGEVPE